MCTTYAQPMHSLVHVWPAELICSLQTIVFQAREYFKGNYFFQGGVLVVVCWQFLA
jgi:hypothetical protein